MSVTPEQLPLEWSSRFAGPSGIRTVVLSWLTAHLPRLLEGMRIVSNLSTAELPDPVRVSPGYEGLWQIDVYPTVAIGVTGSSGYVLRDHSPLGDVFEINYTLSVYYWVEDHGEDAAISVIGKRDAYAMAVRSALLLQPTLGTLGQAADGTAYLRTDESTIAEHPYDPSNTRGGRYIAAGMTSIDVKVSEITSLTPVGTTETVHLVGLRVVPASKPGPL